MNIEPLGKNVLLSQDENHSDHSEGGILLPGTLIERDKQAKVVAIGPEVSECAVGDYVVFRAGKSQEIAGRLIVAEADLLALVHPQRL